MMMTKDCIETTEGTLLLLFREKRFIKMAETQALNYKAINEHEKKRGDHMLFVFSRKKTKGTLVLIC